MLFRTTARAAAVMVAAITIASCGSSSDGAGTGSPASDPPPTEATTAPPTTAAPTTTVPAPSVVGTWLTTLPLGGRPTEVIWEARQDGTCEYRLVAGGGNALACDWSVDGNVLYEHLEGQASSATVSWTGPDAMTLTIIDNGAPGEAGTQRHYVRQ